MSFSVACIIPVFNGERFLKDALSSVLAQTRRLDEIWVVDDGSTDSTPRIAAQYRNDVRVIRTENSGVAAARNRGVEMCGTAYAAFLDADDRWHPEKTEMFLAEAERQGGPDLLFCDALAIDPEGGARGV